MDLEIITVDSFLCSEIETISPMEDSFSEFSIITSEVNTESAITNELTFSHPLNLEEL